jgi:Amt family ammonium transporter
MAQLHERGCQFALDDFGTGMSSFVYLKELDVQYLKIAGPFVKNMANSSLDEAIVRNFATFARQMDLVTIAEWVEDTKTLDLLRDMKVDYAQGFLHGRARPLGQSIAAGTQGADDKAA